MFQAACKGPSGENVCLPDVCLTPPVPPTSVAYVNIGLHSVAESASKIVSLCAMPALNILSYLPTTSGDEAGTLLGVKSGTVCGPGYFLSGSPIVYIELLPAVRVTSRASGNNENAQGLVVTGGQPVVFFAFDAQESTARDQLFDGAAFEARISAESTGTIRIDRFARDSVRLFFNAQKALWAAGARTFVIDLRGCAGGDLEAAYALAAEFLPAGAALGTVIDADGDAEPRFARHDGPYRFPLVLQVDRATKSAAEVFVGALSYHRRAVVTGETTFGKASVQCIDTATGSLVTCARVELPGGDCYEGIGIAPDSASSH